MVFPAAVLSLFASDVAGPARRARPAIATTAAALARRPCSAVLDAVDNKVNGFFNGIGRLSANEAQIRRIFRKPWAVSLITGIGNALLISQAEASAAAGVGTLPGRSTPTTIDRLGSGMACIFADPGNSTSAHVRIDALDSSAAAFDAYPAPFGDIRCPNVGDGCFYRSSPEGPTNLFVRRSNIVMLISVLTSDGLNQATKLARIAVGGSEDA